MISFYQYIYTSRDVNGEVNGWKMNDDAHTGNMQLRNFQCIKDALSLWNDDDGNLMNGKKHRKTLTESIISQQAQKLVCVSCNNKNIVYYYVFNSCFLMRL